MPPPVPELTNEAALPDPLVEATSADAGLEASSMLKLPALPVPSFTAETAGVRAGGIRKNADTIAGIGDAHCKDIICDCAVKRQHQATVAASRRSNPDGIVAGGNRDVITSRKDDIPGQGIQASDSSTIRYIETVRRRCQRD